MAYRAATGTIGGVLTNGGSAIAAGQLIYVPVDLDWTITSGELLAKPSGSVVLDVWRCTYAQFDAGTTHPKAADSITGDNPLTIVSSTKASDSTLDTWLTSLSSGDVLAFVVISAATITQLTVTLNLSEP